MPNKSQTQSPWHGRHQAYRPVLKNSKCIMPKVSPQQFGDTWFFPVSISDQAHFSLSLWSSSLCLARPKPHAWLFLYFSQNPNHPLPSSPRHRLVPTPFHQLIPLHPFFTLLLLPPWGLAFNRTIYQQQPCQIPRHRARQISLERVGGFKGDHGERERDTTG